VLEKQDSQHKKKMGLLIMSYFIYGKIGQDSQQLPVVSFVGCSKDASRISTDHVLLQTVADHPEAHWVKWCLRFRRTIKNNTALSHPLADYFKNPRKLKQMLNDEEYRQLCAEQNADFLEYHGKNSDVMAEMIAAARTEKASGRPRYAVEECLTDVRWGNTATERTDQFKINDKWTPWYSRAIQMTCPDLVGFFKMRSSVPDCLVWTDGRTWEEFASENSDKLQWSDPFEESPDPGWEYTNE